MLLPDIVAFPAPEAKQIRDSFYSTLNKKGHSLINQAEATSLAKRLSAKLLPSTVFQLLAQSLAQVAHNSRDGLRIRLAMDATLLDLPWEYVSAQPHRRPESASSGHWRRWTSPSSALQFRLQPAARERKTTKCCRKATAQITYPSVP
jgi:hypothetical protein